MGANPPVANAAMLSQTPCRAARPVSIPAARQRKPRATAAPTTMASVVRAMKRAVSATWGMNRSLRPSEVYRLASMRRPNKPRDRATTMNPSPPTSCSAKRQVLSAFERCGRSCARETPVVVSAETHSNSASKYPPKCPDSHNGTAARSERNTQAIPVTAIAWVRSRRGFSNAANRSAAPTTRQSPLERR